MNKLFICMVTLVFASACSRVPITNRKQSTWESEAALQKMSDTAYINFIATHKLTKCSVIPLVTPYHYR